MEPKSVSQPRAKRQVDQNRLFAVKPARRSLLPRRQPLPNNDLEWRASGRWRDKHVLDGARLLEHGWAGLSDLYELYLLSGRCPGKFELPVLLLLSAREC